YSVLAYGRDHHQVDVRVDSRPHHGLDPRRAVRHGAERGRGWDTRHQHPEREAVTQPRNTLPATASSFFSSSGSRASGAVIIAASSGRSEPTGHGSCSRGKSRASRATSVFAFSAFAVSTLMMSCTVTASWSGCQQSKSVTIATVA